MKTERICRATTGGLIYDFTVGYAGLEQLVISETRCCDSTPFFGTSRPVSMPRLMILIQDIDKVAQRSALFDFDVLGVKHDRAPH